MGADISRVRFDPLRDFAGVILQQGRLLLDADFNEYVALLDRRLRAETCDLTSFGPDSDHAGVAWVPRQTPNAFLITVGDSGGESTLTIGRGRMYVDGLLAENHGLPPEGFDPLLSEATGTTDTPYDRQPYWPTPDELPTNGTYLAYLDVWERECTCLEDPSLVEVAVGVDTTARVQTAWQVRLLSVDQAATCATTDADLSTWLDTITPSAGRLTTGTVEIAPTDDPCTLPPTGGYRGLENQTYRVEIHDGSNAGSTATFKWSRTDGSVAMSVAEMVTPTVLRLSTLGKDDQLSISTNDWVEILDDHYELGQRAGEMRIVTVDRATRTIAFTPAIPVDLQPADAADAAARHLRVRRWDQAGVVKDAAGNQLVDLDAPGANGLIPVPTSDTTQVVLESGVVVSFSLGPDPGTFHPGDYWIFAARTADTSVEHLDAAPPLGIHHHYARLGFVTFPGSQKPSPESGSDQPLDCRRLWPAPPSDQGQTDNRIVINPDMMHALPTGGPTLVVDDDLYPAWEYGQSPNTKKNFVTFSWLRPSTLGPEAMLRLVLYYSAFGFKGEGARGPKWQVDSRWHKTGAQLPQTLDPAGTQPIIGHAQETLEVTKPFRLKGRPGEYLIVKVSLAGTGRISKLSLLAAELTW